MDTTVNTGTAPVQSQTQEPVQQTPVQTTTPAPASTPLTELEIDGIGKVKVDDIKEWRQGYMRQGDYTKKTQSIAQQRQEMKEALEVFNYLKANPQLAQQIANGQPVNMQGTPLNTLNPMKQEVDTVQMELANMKLDIELDKLKNKYKDFDEVAVLTKADELGVKDLEFVYKALKADSVDGMEQKIRQQVEAELTKRLQDNANATQTIIQTTDTTANTNYGLTEQELLLCAKAGWNPETYAKRK